MLQKQSSMRVAQQQTSQATVIPAPVGGMDDRVGVASDNLDVCLWAINMMPAQYGCRVRQGYRVWQQGLPSEVRTVMPYVTFADGGVGAGNKLFAVCAEGIYDVTTYAGTPSQEIAFTDTGDNSGWGVFTHYVDQSGDDILYYADGANGLFIYQAGAWAQASGITAAPGSIGTIDVTKIAYIVVHKLRIWLIERDANKAWYLGVGAFTGEATEFFFGNKFKHGGDLVGLFNWTVDGGAGRDDHLVAVSRGGDVLPYTGDDPSSSMTWENTGVFFIGRVPRGNRVASEYGGELFLLSSYGVTPMSQLISGAEAEDNTRASVGQKIARLMRIDMRGLVNFHGWNIKFVADEGVIVVNTPKRSDDTYRQYVMNTGTAAWGLWRDIPYVCGESYDGDLLIGDPEGRLLRMDQSQDNIGLNESSGEDIRWYLLSSFTTLGAPALNKRVKFIRPNFSVGTSAPTIETYALYNYYALEPAMPVTGPNQPTGAVWDTALWDVDQWSQLVNLPFYTTRGAWGMGRTVAIAMTGRSNGNTIFASWDVMWDTGGFL